MQVERLDFVAVPSRDPERSRQFYVETLGLRPDERGRLAFFADPDGNDLMLRRRYAPYSDGSTP